LGAATAKKLGAREQLNMHFQPDDDAVAHGIDLIEQVPLIRGPGFLSLDKINDEQDGPNAAQKTQAAEARQGREIPRRVFHRGSFQLLTYGPVVCPFLLVGINLAR
jgi:hypothetical protein